MSKYIFGIRALYHAFLMKLLYRNNFSFKGIFGVGPNVNFRIRGRGNIVIGNRVFIHGGSKFIANNGQISIGDNVFFNYSCMIVSHESIFIGDNCSLGPGVKFFDHDHDMKNAKLKEQVFKSNPIVIEDDVWIGANCVILRGVHIGKHSIVGAGTVIRKGIYPPYSLIKNEGEVVVSSLKK